MCDRCQSIESEIESLKSKYRLIDEYNYTCQRKFTDALNDMLYYLGIGSVRCNNDYYV